MKIEIKKFTKISSEFILIVVGILLALQIENWNEDRKQNEFTRETLLEISASLRADVSHLNSRIKRLNDVNLAMTSVSKALFEQSDYSSSFDVNYSVLSYYILLELKTGSYETLKVTGLNVVKNPKLRSELVNVYDYLYPRIHWMLEQEFNHPNRTYFLPVYKKYTNYAATKNTDNFYLTEVINYSELLRDPDVVKAVRQKSNSAQGMVFRFQRLIVKIESLLKIIDQELK